MQIWAHFLVFAVLLLACLTRAQKVDHHADLVIPPPSEFLAKGPGIAGLFNECLTHAQKVVNDADLVVPPPDESLANGLGIAGLFNGCLTRVQKVANSADLVIRPPSEFLAEGLGIAGLFKDRAQRRRFRYLGGTFEVSSSLHGGVGTESTTLADYEGWATGRGFSILFEKGTFKATLGGGIGAGGNGGTGAGAGGGALGGGAGAGAGAVDGAGVGIGIGGGFSIDDTPVWGFGFGDAVGFNGGGGGGAGGSNGACAEAGGGKSGGLTSLSVACAGPAGSTSTSQRVTNVGIDVELGPDVMAFGAGSVSGDAGGAAGAAAGPETAAQAVGFGNGVPETAGISGNATAESEQQAAAAAAVGEGSLGGFSSVFAITDTSDAAVEATPLAVGEPTPIAVADAASGRTVAAAAAAGQGVMSSGTVVDGTFTEFSQDVVERLTDLSVSLSEELVTSLGDDISRAVADEFGLFAFELVDKFLRFSLDVAGLLDDPALKRRQMPANARRLLLGDGALLPLACIRKERGICKKNEFFRDSFRFNQRNLTEAKTIESGYEFTTFISQDSKAVLG